MNEKRVEADHREGEKDDYVIHSFWFPFCLEPAADIRRLLFIICVWLGKNCAATSGNFPEQETHTI